MKRFLDEDWDILEEDVEPISKLEIQFEKEVHDLIQSFVEKDSALHEEFISKNAANIHYNKHCLCGISSRRSKRSKIYYDFSTKNDYVSREKIVNNKVNNTNLVLRYLGDAKKIEKYFHNLFSGNTSLYLSTSCGFENNTGPVSLGINAFSTDVTKNYLHGNTSDFLVLDRDKTITMYPIDAHYLETKLNNIISNYTKTNNILKFNND